ncbi:cellulose synthase [Nocardioides donggukensis]|uniref:Cellulose synthase n=1 Tax=Nocardioides donggukensis TaxID=2774019 RepID=A0A927K7T0_9ACTN|nr:cellulose synthase [Nocardioides donggukensis]MBD8869245.1 cellulose synthase [Nocardioides donggukensis]
MDDVTWLALTLALTGAGAAWTVHAFRRRGTLSGLRGLAITLLPLAALLTGTLRMFTRITDAVLDWATSLVFSPVVWLGVSLFGVSVLLFVLTGFAARRSSGALPEGGSEAGSEGRRVGRGRRAERSGELPAARRGEPAIGDDMADIEAILKKRGIT